MDLFFLYIITFFELLYLLSGITSCINWGSEDKKGYQNKILFIRNYKERYKRCNKNNNLQKYYIQQKVSKINSKLVSSFESPIVGINLGNILKNKNKNKYLFFSQNNILNLSGSKSELKISSKLQKELILRRNKNLINILLCLHYVPTISNEYLKKSLNNFHLSDLNIKENILYHLTLKCLYGFEKNKNILETIHKNNYKFILQHSKILKKITKYVQISEEKNCLQSSKRFDKLKNNLIRTHRNNSWVENKVIDVYLKIRKKINIIFINTKKKKYIFQTYKKIIGNIKYYDVYDKLIILNYLYKNKKYRECFLFFKKYIYNSIFEHNTQQKSKYFIINFINILNHNNILNIYLMRIHNSYNFLLRSILLSKIQDKHKLNFLQINVDNFIQKNLKDTLYLGIKQDTDVDKIQNANSNNSNTNLTYLFYTNLLNIFLKKKNYYFSGLFLKQFYSHYMDNIYDHKIANDEKFFFFLITLAFSLKIFYLKKKGNITTHGSGIFGECKENAKNGGNTQNGGNVQSKQFEALDIFSHMPSHNFNHVNIFGEDLFSSETTNLAAPFEVVNKIINLNKLDEEEIDTYKHFYVLLLWQYVYLLRPNLKNINFENVHYFNINKEEPNQDNSSILKEKKKDNFFSKIIKGYKKILNKKISTHPNEEILIYNQAFEELNFFIENYLTDIINKNINNKNEEKYILPDILSNLMDILSMHKINISFFFSVLYFLDLNNKKLIKIILKKKLFKNINKNITKIITKRFRKEIQINKKNEQTPFLYEYILSEYKEIYDTYKNITNYSTKKDIKKLIKKITGKNERKHHHFKIFKKPIFALNLKQLFFIFYSLSHFKMDKEIIYLFQHAIKNKYLKKKNFIHIFKDKNEEKQNHTNNNIEENINLYKKIFFIYHNSILSLDNSFYNPRSNKWGSNYSKYFFYYSNNPLHIYKYVGNKYEEKLKKKEMYNLVRQNKNCREYDNKIEDELEKIENIEFFGIKNIERIKKSKIFKKFFINKIYNFINKNDYTLILNGLMKYLLKNVTTLRASQIEKKWETSEKKKKKLWTKYVYLYFYLTWQCYLKTHKMSNIIFLILLKTSLLMNDINNFNNLLLLNKKLAHTNYMCINSMINNDSNFLLLNLKKKYISSFKIPIDMYIIHNKKLIIYNLNYFQVTKIINNFINVETQIIFFIDCRQTFINLINLDNFFNLSFFKNNKFIHFLNHHNLILNENNFFKKSKFVLFFGNCINKKAKIIKYFSSHYKNYNIQKNKSIKDALIISVYD
ncbi:hypothetical protein YYC_05170 [Plasmodium yoelii 17X]|uniref:Uncharacterized protein n=1 Tax=Plasmodium yoelii 17X TaxID=1323249 RepID=V7PB46_PLAYE|nr:hypothetical protein YYC_05170 [Plasmodium yoelii 17X]